MAANVSLYDFADDEFIDMELSSSPTTKFYYSSSNSSPQSREFEFQMGLTCNDKEAITSPADDLFYKGKLLPLYLPPRLQMVENILRGSTTATTAMTRFDVIKFENEDYYPMPFTEPCTNVANTPLESANISPSESCRVSCELSPDDYYLEWSTESGSFINNQPENNSTWSNKLRVIKHYILGEKLRASRAYLKSLFGKSPCSDESCGKANVSAGAKNLPKAEDKHLKIAKKSKLGLIGRPSHTRIVAAMDIDRKRMENAHRRSFSSAIRRRSPNKCLSSSSSKSSSSSSSFSLSSGGFHDLHFLRRTSSATEIESSIQAAIAYCKKSQQVFDSTDSSREPGICSCSSSRIAGEERQEGPALCSIG